MLERDGIDPLALKMRNSHAVLLILRVEETSFSGLQTALVSKQPVIKRAQYLFTNFNDIRAGGISFAL